MPDTTVPDGNTVTPEPRRRNEPYRTVINGHQVWVLEDRSGVVAVADDIEDLSDPPT